MRSRSTAPRTKNTLTINDTIGGIVAAALSTCFVALLLELVFPRATASAAGMLHQHPHASVGERSSGYDCCRPRRPTADYLYRRSVACGALLCGAIGIALVSSAFAGCAIARMVGHSQNRYAMAAWAASPRARLRQPLVGDFISGVAFGSLCSAPSSKPSGATPTQAAAAGQHAGTPHRLVANHHKGMAPLWWYQRGQVTLHQLAGHPIASTGCPDFLWSGSLATFFKTQ